MRQPGNAAMSMTVDEFSAQLDGCARPRFVTRPDASADPIACFQHEHFAIRCCKRRRGSETGSAGTNHNDVR